MTRRRRRRRVTLPRMGLLDGKKIVITGVLTDASLAYGVAALAQREGADIVLTGAGRALSLTQRTGRKLPTPVDVFELDVTSPEHLVAVREALARSGAASTACCTASASPPRPALAKTSSPHNGTTSPSPCT